MNKLFLALVGLTALTMVAADCPNACSGHGDCETNWDFCSCYTGYLGADCSQRLCQFGLAWIDIPQGDLNHDNVLSGGFGNNMATAPNRPTGTADNTALNPMWRFEGWWERHPAALYGTNNQNTDMPFYVRADEGHFYAECSSRGTCNRDTGLCDCLTGYEGAACNRTVCQNDCSGHGTCQTITEVTPDHLHYRLWDADKTRYCECDGGYFGMDCSQRACMKNDDPLTTKASRVDYTDGLLESNEVQIVDVRCPYNGEMLDPSISLTYTDVQFGDEYETGRFDPSDTGATNEAAVMALLKGLPNQVLADYTVDGANVVTKVQSVSASQLEADSWYRWEIEFDEHLGDVPLLGGTAYFKCKGGAEVSTQDPATGAYSIENVQVTYNGDGPEVFLEFDGPVTTGTPDVWDFVVKDINGDNFNGETTPISFNIADSETAMTAATFTREASKVNTEFQATDGLSRVHLNIKIHVTPVVTVTNNLYTLDTATATRVIKARSQALGARDLTVTSAVAQPAYNQRHFIELVNSGADTMDARWYINDEFISMINVVPAGGNSGALAAQTIGIGTFTGTFHTFPTTAVAYIEDLSITASDLSGAADEEGETWEFHSEKTAEIDQAGPVRADGTTAVDVIGITFDNQMAPTHAIQLVLRVVETHDTVDRYQWKVAGDTRWMNPLQGEADYTGDNSGFPIPASTTRVDEVEGGAILDNIQEYLEVHYPNDPMRAGLANVRVNWSEGSGNDHRICSTSASAGSNDGKYYIRIGTQGVNDSPECSDRGICDYGSGLCRCFKGYAGIDCSEQNALSQGYSGTTSAF